MKIARTGVFLLLALVVLSFMILDSRGEPRVWPSLENFRGTGTAAFGELLKRQGYTVALSREPIPRLKATDLAVVPTFSSPNILGAMRRTADPLAEEFPADWQAALTQHRNRGGKVLILVIPSMALFPNDSGTQGSTFRHARQVSEFEATFTPMEGPTGAFEEESPAGAPFFRSAAGVFSTLESERGGVIVTAVGGVVATNRFIGLSQNADLLMAHVQALAPKGSRIVFVEAGFGNSDELSIVSILGSWAVAVRWQLILVTLVAAWTLSRRFGRKESEKPALRGARDMIDALAQALRTGARSRLALEAQLESSEVRLRRVMKAASSVPMADLLHRTHPSVANAFKQAKAASLRQGRVPMSEVLRLVKELESELSLLEHDRRSKEAPRWSKRGQP
jgi:hypothetical protein